MPSRSIITALLAIAVTASLGVATPVLSAPLDFTDPAFAPVTGPTSIPIGHSEFCKAYRDECGPNAEVLDAAELSSARWQQLVQVNNALNSAIVPVTDQDLYNVAEFWAYPEGYGDCEDIALAKRRELIAAGWDPSTLLMAVVREPNGEGHAVLMARTDRGDLVLDNQDGVVRVWTETPYQFIKRQSQQHAGEWVDIIDDRIVVAAVR